MEFFAPRRLLFSIVVLMFAWAISNVIFPLDSEVAATPAQQPPAALSNDR